MKRTLIIAEAGVNHNGDINIARKLIDVAKEAGVDAVKFQTFKTENAICRDAKKADYQMQTTESEESQFDMVKKLELSEEMHDELIRYCKEKKIMFLSTPFDLDSIDLLEKYDMSIMKIPSGEITNYPYLVRIAQTGKKIIMSTGMCYLSEVEDAVKILHENGAMDITLLHCNTEYPTPMKDVNLNAMDTMRRTLDLSVGYSDHTVGIEIPIAAVALGATVIEKHFTLSREMEGPDHKASVEPEELKAMVHAIRNVDIAMGNGIKEPSESERKNITVARKSIVAKKDITVGSAFSEENITTKRPGTGLTPMQWNNVIGKVAKENYKMDEMVKL